MPELVSYDFADGVASVIMDDGKVNALSQEMLGALHAALDRATADGAVLLLSGREGVFSAGFDLKVLRGGGEPMRAMLRQGFELAERLVSFPTPVVAGCTGHALAMGCFLLLAADHRVGADGAYKIGANEVAIGLTMPHTAVELCRDRLTPSWFNRAVVTAELAAPADAATGGFLDRVVQAGEVRAEALATARSFSATLDRRAHHETKLRARAGLLRRLREAIEADDRALAAEDGS